MATKRKLQIRYGAAASRPTLATGELGLDTDTGAEALYVGTPAGNKVVASMGVKKYVALLTQSGTSAPVATVLENTLGGTVVWTRDSIGIFFGTLSGVFTANKTFLSANLDQSTIEDVEYMCWLSWNSSSVVALGVVNSANTASDGIGRAYVSITVYP